MKVKEYQLTNTGTAMPRIRESILFTVNDPIADSTAIWRERRTNPSAIHSQMRRDICSLSATTAPCLTETLDHQSIHIRLESENLHLHHPSIDCESGKEDIASSVVAFPGG